MKKILCLSAMLLLASPFAFAQDAAVRAAPAASAVQPQSIETVENIKGKSVTHITHSDAGSTIDEVREGADTKSVVVKPAYNAPSYSIMPDARTGQPGNYGNQGGTRVWKVLSF